jgi:hypothetical protein
LAQAVWKDENTGANFAQRTSLFKDRDVDSSSDKRVCGGEAADSSSDNSGAKASYRHGSFLESSNQSLIQSD